jgi:hypothetical protein
MSDALLLVAMSLFAWRVWRFVAEDTFAPVRVPRESFIRRVGEDHWSVELLTCPWCAGGWISFATVAAVWAVRPLPLPALWFGAVSALVGLVAKWEQAP